MPSFDVSRPVDFGDLVLGRGEPVDELRLIRDQQEAAGVFIEPADRGDDRIAPAPAVGKEIVDRRTFPFIV